MNRTSVRENRTTPHLSSLLRGTRENYFRRLEPRCQSQRITIRTSSLRTQGERIQETEGMDLR